MCRARPADDAILDEAFLRERWLSSFPRTLAFLATDVAAAARKRGFQGVTVVLTGSSRGDVARLGALPHVDVCAEKGTPMPELSARLRRALAAKEREGA